MSEKKKYYVVLRGFQTGITDNWEQCKNMVQQYSGNQYRGFYTLNEAIHWIDDYMSDRDSLHLCCLQGKSMVFKGRDALLSYLYYGLDG